MNEEDKMFLWNLMPDWVKKPEPGLCSTMYGTGSFKGDWAIHERMSKLLGWPLMYPTMYIDVNDDLAVESLQI